MATKRQNTATKTQNDFKETVDNYKETQTNYKEMENICVSRRSKTITNTKLTYYKQCLCVFYCV